MSNQFAFKLAFEAVNSGVTLDTVDRIYPILLCRRLNSMIKWILTKDIKVQL